MRQQTQFKSDLTIDSFCMSEIWNAHLHAQHDLLFCNPCQGDAYFHQRSYNDCDQCHIGENACFPDDCFDDYHDDVHHIACDHDYCSHDNALVTFNEHHGMRASCDLGLLRSALCCDQYLDQLSSCLSSACPTLP